MLPAVRVACLAAMCLACASTGGELGPFGAVTFRTRPLAGPGSKGPHEIAPESEGALEAVRAYLEANPQVGRLRIECAVNPMMMGRTPDPSWGAELATLVASWLVERGIDCRRLEPIGRLDPDVNAPAERVRFFVPGRGPARPAGATATADPCSRR